LRANKLTEAESVYRARLALMQSSPDGTDDRIASTRKTLTDILKKEGKTNEIEALFRPAAPPPNP
jgi:hypothetical protein